MRQETGAFRQNRLFRDIMPNIGKARNDFIGPVLPTSGCLRCSSGVRAKWLRPIARNARISEPHGDAFVSAHPSLKKVRRRHCCRRRVAGVTHNGRGCERYLINLSAPVAVGCCFQLSATLWLHEVPSQDTKNQINIAPESIATDQYDYFSVTGLI